MAEIGVYLLSSVLGAGYLFNKRKQPRDLRPPNQVTPDIPVVPDNIYNNSGVYLAQQETAKRATIYAEASKNPKYTNIIPLYYNTLWTTEDDDKVQNKTYDKDLIYSVVGKLDPVAVERIEAKSNMIVTDNWRHHDPEWGIVMDRPVHSRAAQMDPLNQIGGSLTGSRADFTHNNMVPFFGSNVTQDLRTDNRAKDGALELYTGQFKLNLQQKTEQPLLFKPVKDLTNVYGQHEQRDMSRYIPSNLGKKNNETAFGNQDHVIVGPGLNKGFTSEPSGGFHDTFRILPKGKTELQVDPVLETEAAVNTVKSAPIGKRALISQIYKNRPELLVENQNGERNFRTVGAVTGRTLRPGQILKATNRKKSTSYIPSAGASVSKNPVLGKAQKSRRVNFLNSPFRNVGNTPKQTNALNKKSAADSTTKRSKNAQPTACLNITGPRKNTVGSKDPARKTRKQHYTQNAKVYGNVATQQPGKLPIGPAPARKTIKQTTLSAGQLGGASTAVKKGLAYNPGDTPRTTVKQTTLSAAQPVGPSTSVSKGVTYNPTDTARITVKQTTISPAQPVGPSTSVSKGVTYNPADTPRTTIKQTTLSSAQPAGPSTSVSKGITYDPTDTARITVKQTTLGPTQLGGASTLVKKTIAYDPTDVARTTIKQTTLSPSQPAGPATKVKKLIAYDPSDTARITVKQTTLSAAQPVGPSTLVKKSIAYDPADIARMTIKQTTLSPSQAGGLTTTVKKNVTYDPADTPEVTLKEVSMVKNYIPVAIAQNKQETSRGEYENARMNTNKASIAKGRKNLTGGAALGPSTSRAVLQHKKVEADQINTRGLIKTSNDFNVYNPTKDRITAERNNVFPMEDTRLDVRILDAFKQNPLTQSLTSAP